LQLEIPETGRTTPRPERRLSCQTLGQERRFRTAGRERRNDGRTRLSIPNILVEPSNLNLFKFWTFFKLPILPIQSKFIQISLNVSSMQFKIIYFSFLTISKYSETSIKFKNDIFSDIDNNSRPLSSTIWRYSP